MTGYQLGAFRGALQDRDRVVYLLRWLCTTCEVPFEGAPGEAEDTLGPVGPGNLETYPLVN